MLSLLEYLGFFFLIIIIIITIIIIIVIIIIIIIITHIYVSYVFSVKAPISDTQR